MDIMKSINNMNLTLARSGDKLKLRGLAALRPDQRESAIKYVRDHKEKIMAALSAQSLIDSDLPAETVLDFNGKRVRTLTFEPQGALEPFSMVVDCSNCPACGTWDHAEFKGKQVCFYTAYYVGKSGRPVACDIAKLNCPKIKKNGGKGKEEPRVSHVVSHVSTQ